MTELTIETAYELAVKKWEWIVEHNGIDTNISLFIPELRTLTGRCSYCELFVHNKPICTGCPLRPKRFKYNNTGCTQPKHPYNIWFMHKSKETAQAVLDLIVKTKPF